MMVFSSNMSNTGKMLCSKSFISQFNVTARNFGGQSINGRQLFTFTERSLRKEYVKKELIGYSVEQMFDVVSDVSNYFKFVPYVKKSFVHHRRGDVFKADLVVGFPPLNECYTSHVTLNPPMHVQSVCNDGRMFKYLLNDWRFSPGLKDIPQSCVIDFKVAFEFKSLIHSQLANLFFDVICHQMEKAFKQEARKRFGSPPIRSHILWSRKS